MPPTPCESDKGDDDWTPYRDHVQFEATDFIYRCNQMLAGDINFITGLWAASLAPHNDSLPFKNAKDLYDMIDAIPPGDIPWQSFSLKYTGPTLKTLGSDCEDPPWTTTNYDIWFHDPHLLIHDTVGY